MSPPNPSDEDLRTCHASDPSEPVEEVLISHLEVITVACPTPSSLRHCEGSSLSSMPYAARHKVTFPQIQLDQNLYSR